MRRNRKASARAGASCALPKHRRLAASLAILLAIGPLEVFALQKDSPVPERSESAPVRKEAITSQAKGVEQAAPPASMSVKLSTDPKGYFEQVYDVVTKAGSIGVNIVLVLFVVALGAAAIWEMRRRSIVIEPIEVPKDLAEKGFTPNVAALRVASEINRLQRAARLRIRREDGFELSATQIDFTVPSAGISYRALLRYVRQFFGTPEERIRGEITRTTFATVDAAGAAHNSLSVVLRTADGRSTQADLATGSDLQLDVLIRSAAFELASFVDPYLIASYWFEEEQGAKDKLFKKTTKALSDCLARTPPRQHHRAYVIWANLLRLQGKLDEAEEKLRFAVASGFRSAQIYNTWGIVLRAKRRLDEAADMYRIATRIDRRYYHALGNLGNNCNDRRKWHLALRYFRRALRINPSYANGLSGLGFALWRLGREREAENMFSRAVDVDPKYGWSYISWARLLRNRGQLDAAILKVNLAVDRGAAPADALALLGDMLTDAGRFEDAERAFSESMEADPSLATGIAGRGYLLRSRGLPAEAIEKYREALKINPTHSGAWGGLIGQLRVCRRHGEAISECERALERDRYQTHIWVQWGKALADLHRIGEAESRFRHAIRIDPRDRWAWQSWGELLANEYHRYQLALEKLQRAESLDPSSVDGVVALAAVLRRVGRRDEAIAKLQDARRLDPRHPWALREWAITMFSSGRRQEVEREVSSAIRAWPGDRGIALRVATILRELGRLDSALDALGPLLVSEPSNSEALVEWARVRKAQGDWADAETKARTAVSAQPWNEWAWRELASVTANRGNFPEVRQVFEDAMKGAPDSRLGRSPEVFIPSEFWIGDESDAGEAWCDLLEHR